ncbi:MAG: glycoside hydrolase family 25 protein [Treponema sp.]|nr:glycoside hydrolase family 25 protein [Treponema sp.]
MSINKKILRSVKTLLVTGLVFTGCASIPKTDDPNKFVFKDALGEYHIAEINHDVPKVQYNKDLFVKKHRRMSYIGDERYTTRLGIDISRHEGEIDWKKVKNAGIEFVIMRIGWRGYQSGILHTDENFHQNIKGALEHGLDIGVYVFSQAINEEEALEEANLVIKELENYKITLPVVFDPESVGWEEARTDDISGEQFTKNTIVFCNRIKEAGYEPMIYSNLIWETEFFDLSQLKEYKIWYADYEKKPQTPYHFDYWQYCGLKLKVPGIKRKVDGDIQLIKVSE